MRKVSLWGTVSTAAVTLALVSAPAAAQTASSTPADSGNPQELPAVDATNVEISVEAESPDTAVQSAGDEAAADDIVVTGFRSSLEKALTLKRSAVGVRDSIVAEDIGKFPEQNVAESLQRIPGVFMSRDGASNEGQRISIRGLGSQYSVTTINGAPVRTTSSSNVGGASRDFNFDVFPSELFGRVDVYKTPLASLEEGGIGGNVDLQTPRPFDSSGRVIRYTATGQYNTTSKKISPRGSLLVSDTWGNFGVLVGVAYAKNENLRSGFQSTGGYNTSNIGDNNFIPAAQRPPGTPLGPFSFALDFDSPRANLGNLTRAQVENAFLPRFFRAYTSNNQRERIGATASLQYKTDTIDISIDGIHANLKDRRDEFTFGVPVRNSRTNNRNALPGRTGNSGLIPIDVKIDENNNLYGTFGNTNYFAESYFYDAETKFNYVIGRAAWNISPAFRLYGQVNYSRSVAEYSGNRLLANIYSVDTTYDPTGNRVYPSISSPIDFTDVANFRASGNNDPGLLFQLNEEVDRQKTGRLVLDFTPAAFGALELHARLGGSYVSTVKDAELRDGSSLASTGTLPGGGTFRQLDIYSFMEPRLQGGSIPNGGNDLFPSDWASFPRSFVMNTLDANGFSRSAPLRADSSFRAEEIVKSAFFELDAKLALGEREIRLNAGIRYSDTKTIIDNASLVNGVFTPNHREGGYKHWLPSISVAVDVLSDVVLRGSAGKTITRASLSNIAGNTRIPNIFEARAVAGNPDLLPQVATQFDAGVEWYFAPGGLLSVGAFKKTLKGTTQAQDVTVPFSSLGLPDTALSTIFRDANGQLDPNLPITLSTFFNSGTIKLSGLEFAYQQNFRFLPQPFDGLGALISYTRIKPTGTDYVTTDGETFTVYQIPKYSYSLTGFYEKGPFALRASYNFRDRSIIELNNNGTNLQRWTGAQGFLDGTVSYKVTPEIELRLDVLNITNTLIRDYFEDPRGGANGEGGNSRLDNALYNGRTISFGVRGRF